MTDRSSLYLFFFSAARVQIDANGTLWMMTNSMPLFIYSRLDPDVYNFRVWRVNTADLVRGTACEP